MNFNIYCFGPNGNAVVYMVVLVFAFVLNAIYRLSMVDRVVACIRSRR